MDARLPKSPSREAYGGLVGNLGSHPRGHRFEPCIAHCGSYRWPHGWRMMSGMRSILFSPTGLTLQSFLTTSFCWSYVNQRYQTCYKGVTVRLCLSGFLSFLELLMLCYEQPFRGTKAAWSHCTSTLLTTPLEPQHRAVRCGIDFAYPLSLGAPALFGCGWRWLRSRSGLALGIPGSGRVSDVGP